MWRTWRGRVVSSSIYVNDNVTLFWRTVRSEVPTRSTRNERAVVFRVVKSNRHPVQQWISINLATQTSNETESDVSSAPTTSSCPASTRSTYALSVADNGPLCACKIVGTFDAESMCTFDLAYIGVPRSIDLNRSAHNRSVIWANCCSIHEIKFSGILLMGRRDNLTWNARPRRYEITFVRSRMIRNFVGITAERGERERMNL